MEFISDKKMPKISDSELVRHLFRNNEKLSYYIQGDGKLIVDCENKPLDFYKYKITFNEVCYA